MSLQPWAVELVDKGAHLERADQKFVPDVLRIEENLCLLRPWNSFAQLSRDAVPGVLISNLEFRAIAEPARVEQQCPAVQIRGELDGLLEAREPTLTGCWVRAVER